MDSSRDSLPLPEAEALDKIADEFEAAFLAGLAPNIEDYCQGQGLSFDATLHELVSLEFELRSKQESSPDVDGYLEKFPSHKEIVTAAVESAQNRLAPAQSSRKTLKSIGRYLVRAVLGKGGFGEVYLAFDPKLQREVAIKVPLLNQHASETQTASFVNEAQLAANLQHAGIVSVHDVDVEAGLPYIVYEYVAGMQLDRWAKLKKLTPITSVRLICKILDAVAHAHKENVIHCDLKLANILIDSEDQPHIADFGLALRQNLHGETNGLSGTPAVMAPEQIRGLRNQLDARTDIWAVGVMLYELLAGTRPFIASDRKALFEAIQHQPPTPISQHNATIPLELQQMVDRCLRKKSDERFSTADELRVSLAAWLDSACAQNDKALSSRGVIPKGLRAYGKDDASFFLSLLPGPREASGLPACVSFWTKKIESQKPDQAFPVGLLYGPSGSGKSSLIHAGVIPNLNSDVVATITVEATAARTELDLEKSLRREFPAIREDQPLAEVVRDAAALSEKKLLLVVDQFEQWLQGNVISKDNQLVECLQLMDGVSTQTILLVRDDFFSSVNLLFQALDTPLQEGFNYQLVSRFSVQHALHVLTLFGQAFETLPDNLDDENKKFLSEAIALVAEEHRVIGVRLALFADLLKHRPWVPSSLENVNGFEGLGVTFLEEVFCGESAGPQRRKLERNCRNVLHKLLPAMNSNIRGAAKSHDELREAAQCQDDQEWHATLQVLDQDLRLITPTDPLQTSPAASRNAGSDYQLTHDYLVPSLREWLSQKQLESHRGRAELTLQELAHMWSHKPQTRFLPSFSEWTSLLALTSRKKWKSHERSLMAASSRFHLTRAALLASFVALLLSAFYVWRRADQADQLVERIAAAATSKLPEIMEDTERLRHWIEPRLRNRLSQSPEESKEEFNISLCLLGLGDSSQLPIVADQLTDASPAQILPVTLIPRDAETRTQVANQLWQRLRELLKPSSNSGNSEIANSNGALQIAGMLAVLDPANPTWQDVSEKVGHLIAQQDRLNWSRWVDLMKPAEKHLCKGLSVLLLNEDKELSPSEQEIAEEAMLEFSHGSLDVLLSTFVDLSPQSMSKVLPRLERGDSKSIAFVRNVLSEEPSDSWAAWGEANETPHGLPPKTIQLLRDSFGFATNDFAVCQTLPIDQLQELLQAMSSAGFSATRVRPFRKGDRTLCSVVWQRGNFNSEVSLGLSEFQIKEKLSAIEESKYPHDVAGYTRDGKEQFCLTLLDRFPTRTESFQVYFGVDESNQWKEETRLAQNIKRIANAFQSYASDEGKLKFCGIIGSSIGPSSVTFRSMPETQFDTFNDLDRIRTDIDISALPEPRISKEYYSMIVRDLLEQDFAQDWLNTPNFFARLLEARFYSGQHDPLKQPETGKPQGPPIAYAKLDKLADKASKQHPLFRDGLLVAGCYFAQTGNTSKALRLLKDHNVLCWNKAEELAATARILAFLGEESEALAELEKLSVSPKQTANSYYELASAYAHCARIVRTRKTKEDDSEDRSISQIADEYQRKAFDYLQQAVDQGFSDRVHLSRDFSWTSLRSIKEYQELYSSLPPAFVYSGIWTNNSIRRTKAVKASSPEDHLSQMIQLSSAGWRPQSISLATSDEVTRGTSIWFKRPVKNLAKNKNELRKINAASAAFELGDYKSVWPLLNVTEDNGIRSGVVHQIRKTPTNLSVLIDRLRAETDPGRRQAILLSLGQFDPSTNPISTSLIETVADWFENDVSAGTHGACRWLLQKWGRSDAIDRVHKKLATGKPVGGRRWYRTKSNDHTFAVIEGPVEFFSGRAPRHITARSMGVESRTRVRIRHSFAVATTEVTAEQILKLHEVIQVIHTYSNSSTWHPDCGAGDVRWKIAALYCEWLNKRENLLDDSVRQYADVLEDGRPMKLPDNYLSRAGYRLPTAAEWEYACRGGTDTRRYFGDTIDFADFYVRSSYNSDKKSGIVASLKPNEFGLFDTLGNVSEWLQEPQVSRYGVSEIGGLKEEISEVREDRTLRLRGNGFHDSPWDTYVCETDSEYPRFRSSSTGLRVFRTMPNE